MKMKLARQLEFAERDRNAIKKRDREACVFCALGYCMPQKGEWTGDAMQVMHIVPRAQLGLGIEQNGVLGCVYHHQMMDNGNQGRRKEMISILEDRMRQYYPGWTRESVIYRKYGVKPVEAACGSRRSDDGAEGIILIENGVDGEIPI